MNNDEIKVVVKAYDGVSKRYKKRRVFTDDWSKVIELITNGVFNSGLFQECLMDEELTYMTLEMTNRNETFMSSYIDFNAVRNIGEKAAEEEEESE